MSIFHNNAIIASSSQGYTIQRSLRLNPSDSAYLSRTPSSASNRRTWTLSFWIKRSSTDTYQMMFQAGNANNVNEAFLYFVGDGISFYQTDGAGNVAFSARPTGVFRDHSAWYHIVLKYDSTQATSTDRVRYYINGVDRTDTSTSFPSLNFECVVNSTATHRIGTRFAGIQYLGAYIADFQLIDGQALDSSYFGQFDSNGIWSPKKYNGSYGTNGFQINFSDTSSNTATTLGKDISGNGNNWTPVNLTVGSNWPNTSYRYWRVIVYNDIDHVPRASRYIMTADGVDTNIVVFTSDNCSDSGTIPASGTSYSYDFGSNKKVTAFKYYSVYNGGSRTGRYEVYYSSDNSNWTEAFRGSMPNNSSCGVITGSVTNFISSDVFVDSPTNGTQIDTGLGGQVNGNYCTLNAISIRRSFALSNGNLSAVNSGNNDGVSTGTFALPSTGKWYWEAIQGPLNGGIYLLYTGLLSRENFPNGNYVNVPGAMIYPRDGVNCFYDNTGTASCVGESVINGDVYGVAYNADTNVVDFYKNGVKYEGRSVTVTSGVTYYPFLSIGNQGPTAHINFGQRPFTYPAPSGYKCLCSANLPAPTITQPSTVMDVKLYTGNGSTQAITGLGFSPDLVWVKGRSTTARNRLFNVLSGVQKELYSDLTNAEATDANGIQSFDSAGFTLGSNDANTLNTTYVGWTWDAGNSTVTNTQGSISSQVRANASAGFSIVTYTGNGTNGATVGHGLGVHADLIIVKNRSAAADWPVALFTSAERGMAWSHVMFLNKTDAQTDSPAGGKIRSGPSNTTTFECVTGSSNAVNVNTLNNNYVAYCFSAVSSYSAMGSYVGNGSSDGPFVYTGFRPRWVMIKRSDNVGSWGILDTARNTFNVQDKLLWANLSDAEGTYTICDALSNGFKLRESTNGFNVSSATYIYAAFAESPFGLNNRAR